MEIDREQQEYLDKYYSTVKRLFNTVDGKFALKQWREWFVETSCLTAISEHTHFMLAKKEFVLELISIADKDISDKETDGNIKLDEDILDD